MILNTVRILIKLFYKFIQDGGGYVTTAGRCGNGGGKRAY